MAVAIGRLGNLDKNHANRDPFLVLTDEEEPDAAEPAVSTHVYFALDPDACQIKIGISENVPRRIADLSTDRGRPLDLLGTLQGGYNLERAMHGRFRPYRVEGREWYSSEIVAEVAALLAA